MSTIITIKNNKKVNAKTAIKKILKDARIKIYQHPFSQQSVNYGSCKLYHKGQSTRGIFIDNSKDEIIIRVNVMSSDEDLNLAVHAAQFLGKICGSPIYVENEPTPIESENATKGDLKQILLENQIAGTSCLQTLMDKNGDVEVGGLFTSFFPTIEMLAGADIGKLHQELISCFLEIQNLESNGVRICNPIIAEKDGKQTTYAVLSPSHPQLITKCECVVLAGLEREQFVIVQAEDFYKNLGFECDKVDRIQRIFPALDHAEFDMLIQKMKPFEKPLY